MDQVDRTARAIVRAVHRTDGKLELPVPASEGSGGTERDARTMMRDLGKGLHEMCRAYREDRWAPALGFRTGP